MQSKTFLGRLACVAMVVVTTQSACAIAGDPIQGIPVGLEGDPGSIVVATTKTDADGKFEFSNLKAGKYRLVIPSDSLAALTKELTGTLILSKRRIVEGSTPENVLPSTARTTPSAVAQLEPERTFTITVTAVNDAPAVILRVDPNTGRSDQALFIGMDGGTIRGSFKIADNESPRPQNRVRLDVGDDRPNHVSDKLPADTVKVTTVVGKFVLFQSGKLTLLVSAKEGEEPKLTEFGRVTAVVVDPTDPMAVKTLPAEEAFKNLPVGTPVKVETNEQGSIIAILVGLLLPKTADANSQGGTKAAADPNAWRYKLQNGEWWYYGVDEKWLVHRGGQWVTFTATVSPGTGPSGPATGTLNNNSGNNPWTGPIVLDNRVDSGRGRTVIPVPADLDGDGRSKPRTLIPGVRLPQQSAPNKGNSKPPLRRTPGGIR